MAPRRTAKRSPVKKTTMTTKQARSRKPHHNDSDSESNFSNSADDESSTNSEESNVDDESQQDDEPRTAHQPSDDEPPKQPFIRRVLISETPKHGERRFSVEFNAKWMSEETLRRKAPAALAEWDALDRKQHLTHEKKGGRKWEVARNKIPSENSHPKAMKEMLRKVVENLKKEVRELSVDDLGKEDYDWTSPEDMQRARDILQSKRAKVTVMEFLQVVDQAYRTGTSTATHADVRIQYVGQIDQDIAGLHNRLDNPERPAIRTTDLLSVLHHSPLQGLNPDDIVGAGAWGRALPTRAALLTWRQQIVAAAKHAPHIFKGGKTWVWGLAHLIFPRAQLEAFIEKELDIDLDKSITPKPHESELSRHWHTLLRETFIATYFERNHEADDDIMRPPLSRKYQNHDHRPLPAMEETFCFLHRYFMDIEQEKERLDQERARVERELQGDVGSGPNDNDDDQDDDDDGDDKPAPKISKGREAPETTPGQHEGASNVGGRHDSRASTRPQKDAGGTMEDVQTAETTPAPEPEGSSSTEPQSEPRSNDGGARTQPPPATEEDAAVNPDQEVSAAAEDEQPTTGAESSFVEPENSDNIDEDNRPAKKLDKGKGKRIEKTPPRDTRANGYDPDDLDFTETLRARGRSLNADRGTKRRTASHHEEDSRRTKKAKISPTKASGKKTPVKQKKEQTASETGTIDRPLEVPESPESDVTSTPGEDEEMSGGSGEPAVAEEEQTRSAAMQEEQTRPAAMQEEETRPAETGGKGKERASQGETGVKGKQPTVSDGDILHPWEF